MSARRPRVWALYYPNRDHQHTYPEDALEEFATIEDARNELAIRLATGAGTATYCCGDKRREHTVWPGHDRHTAYALVWLAQGRTLPPGQPVDATSHPDQRWTLGARGGVHRADM